MLSQDEVSEMDFFNAYTLELKPDPTCWVWKSWLISPQIVIGHKNCKIACIDSFNYNFRAISLFSFCTVFWHVDNFDNYNSLNIFSLITYLDVLTSVITHRWFSLCLIVVSLIVIGNVLLIRNHKISNTGDI